MSETIRFLESVGRNQLPADQYAAAVNALDIDAAPRRALQERDQEALARLLQGRDTMRCMIFVPD